MRFNYLILASRFVASFIAGYAVAKTGAAADAAHNVLPVMDNDRGAYRVMIDGREIAWFDSAGLHVNGEITYNGGKPVTPLPPLHHLSPPPPPVSQSRRPPP